MASNSRPQTCFSFFMPQKSFKGHLHFYCIKQIDRIFRVHVYCNRSLTPLDFVSCRTFLFFTRIRDLLHYTHTEKCNIFVNFIVDYITYLIL